MKEDRDFWWGEEMEDASSSCYPVWVGAEDPLFMLYTRYVGRAAWPRPAEAPILCRVSS